MRRDALVADALADAVLAAEPQVASLVQRVAWTLGRKHRWITPFCTRMFHRFGSSLTQADRRALVEWIARDAGYLRAWTSPRPPRIAHFPLDPPRMSPRRGALAAGIVVNRRPNPRRAEFDRLKALLTNCARHGALSQNRDAIPQFRAHLAGRVEYIGTLNPARGARLRGILDSIAWEG